MKRPCPRPITSPHASHTPTSRHGRLGRALGTGLGCAVVLVLASFALAQVGPLDPNTQRPPATQPFAPNATPGGALVGTWQTQIPNQGGPPAMGLVTYRPDGTYRETLQIQGETVGYWMGHYQLTPDGTLMLTETETSPQLCFQGQCQPNEPPTRTLAQIVAMDASSYTASYQDGMGGTTLTFRRVGGPAAGGGPAVGPPAGTPLPPGAIPMADPSGFQPSPDVAPPPPTPAWTGSWSDGTVAIHFSAAEGAVLEIDGAPYPLSLSGDEARLEGTFESGAEQFPIVVERTEAGLRVESDGATFDLGPMTPEGGEPTGNPLGN